MKIDPTARANRNDPFAKFGDRQVTQSRYTRPKIARGLKPPKVIVAASAAAKPTKSKSQIFEAKRATGSIESADGNLAANASIDERIPPNSLTIASFTIDARSHEAISGIGLVRRAA